VDQDKIKANILMHALSHVATEGWSAALLERAALEAEGDASLGWRLFPRGPLEAIELWHKQLDEEMEASLPSPEDLRVRERVKEGVKTRLLLMSPHRAAAKKTALYLAGPSHLGQGARLVYQTVNKIWYYAGDTSTDYNFYTKRALLAGVYGATFLYWLKDESDQYENTWRFLDKRIEDILTLPKLPSKIFRMFG